MLRHEHEAPRKTLETSTAGGLDLQFPHTKTNSAHLGSRTPATFGALLDAHGLLKMGNAKMAGLRSCNVVNVVDLLQRFSPETVSLPILLSSHYHPQPHRVQRGTSPRGLAAAQRLPPFLRGATIPRITFKSFFDLKAPTTLTESAWRGPQPLRDGYDWSALPAMPSSITSTHDFHTSARSGYCTNY